ncbi:nuclear shell protein [Erwinia phage vB_EamM_Desertfox]|uniref:Uncharacterized protein n=3 Tax=Agricanvirus TaxID=1984776 RepID=A0A173GDF6_9CAUD|nr:nuclear shell protein [Erwinia phage vB_EamM_Simmy50]YP_009621963.1 nuclear shell protein [Erwinia phage vB_EamM_Desertfox]ANH51686.1 hypothetical protein SIMMY50_227 [Erwinia phage vB_EamM_Simmy50]AUG86329.1 hypothetical protein DESERTFOX_222 [Erwinia phage vB_EamM_Desertfox]QBP07329.1 hypothetical protein REBECCA_224 [Erwinia phage Rebecca]
MKTPEGENKAQGQQPSDQQQPNNSAMGDALLQAQQRQSQQPQQQQTPPQQAPQSAPQPVQATTQQQQHTPQFHQTAGNSTVNNTTNNTNTEQQQPRQSRIYGMNERRSRIFDATAFGENFKIALEATKEVLEGYEDKGFNKSFFLVPVADATLHCNGLAYASVFNFGGSTKAIVYTLMLENTGSPLKPQRGNDPLTGEPFEIPRMTGSQYDNTYWARVAQLVAHRVGNNAEVLDAGACVVHAEMKWDDKSAIKQLLNNAENATMAYANSLSGYRIEPPFNIAQEVDPNIDRITAGFNFNPQPLFTVDGQPIRNDVEVKLSAYAEGAGQVQTTEAITTVNGYVELIAAPQQQMGYQQQMMMGMNPQQAMQFYRRFYPQFTITSTGTGISNAQGPEFQLLALFAASLIGENSNWHHAFAPKMVNGVDINDIGAINYELKMGLESPDDRPKKIITKDHSFTTQALHQLLYTACHESMSIAIDIEETGTRTWVNSMLLLAGGQPNGNAAALSPQGQQAHKAIIQAANNLTNGEFSKHFTDQNQLIAVRDGTRIQGGFYVSKDNHQKMDIRNVDLLAVLNFVGETDPRIVEEWKIITSSTSGMSTPKRVALRQQKLQQLLGESFVLKAYYERVVINWAFMDALRKAITAAGLIVRPENTNMQYNVQSYGTPMAQLYGMPTNIGSSLQQGAYATDNQGRVVNMAAFRTGGAFGTFNG